MMVYSDPTKGRGAMRRPVSAISWCSDGGSKIAIGYCSPEFLGTPDNSPNQGKLIYLFQENISDVTHHINHIHCHKATHSVLRIPQSIVMS